jgi:phosphopantetheinyl transferase
MPQIQLIKGPQIDSRHRILATQLVWMNSELPVSIPGYLYEQANKYDNEDRKRIFLQSRLMIHSAIEHIFDVSNDLQILKEETDKPYGLISDQHIYLSISHSSKAVFTIIDTQKAVGIDAELIHRNIHPNLRNRMLHPDEKRDTQLQSVETLLIWVVKESILKLIGSGLRVAMSSICLQLESANSFSTTVNGEPVVTNVIIYEDHYLAISEYI